MNLFTTNDGTILNYKTVGEGYAIVLIHTAFDNFTVFHDIEDDLAAHNQVVLIDLRGHGYSDKPNHIEFTDYANDVKELLDYLYIDKCAVIGHEMGASVAAEFSATNPDYVSSLTMINPTMIEDSTPEERIYRRYSETIRTWDEEKQHKFLADKMYYDKKKVNKFLKHVENTNGIATSMEMDSIKASFKCNNIRAYLGNVTVPTQIIAGQHGERTTIVEAKEVADYIKDSEFEVFQSSGLYPFVEQKAEFLNLVNSFIKRFK